MKRQATGWRGLSTPSSIVRWLCSIGLRGLLWVCAVSLLSACSTNRPWVNQPLSVPETGSALTSSEASAPQGEPPFSPPIIGAVAFSGGGARAAAFGLGVLQELKATEFDWQGQSTTLLEHMDLVSGVSGGSVLAAYYAAFGDEVFTHFERDFLLVNFQSSLIRDALSPATLYRLSSPWYGRSNALAARLDTLYRGKTFGDLSKQAGHPRLLITAADLTTGAPFEFTPEQFGLICSDLDSVPLAYAVAASSAVPLLLSPVTIHNFAGQCPSRPLPYDAALVDTNLSARFLHMIAKSYRNAEERPYIHLVDGGVVDNLGVRGLLDRASANGSLNRAFQGLPPGSVHEVVLISVNSERDTAERIDHSDKVPTGGQVLDSLVFGAGSRQTTETTAMVNDAAKRMADELREERLRPGSPFAEDAEIHVINVSLRDLQNPDIKSQLLNVPTALTILPIQVKELQKAGREVLRESPAFQRLLRSLGAPQKAPKSKPSEGS